MLKLKEGKKAINYLKNTLLINEAQVVCTKTLCETVGTRNENRVYLIEEVLNKNEKNG